MRQTTTFNHNTEAVVIVTYSQLRVPPCSFAPCCLRLSL